MVKKNIPDEFGFDPFQEIQVLTPMHRGQTGSINLNKSLQAILNPDGIGFLHRENLFKTGDRVMQQHNDYKKNIFNGDMGIISECDPINKEIEVRFDHSQECSISKKWLASTMKDAARCSSLRLASATIRLTAGAGLRILSHPLKSTPYWNRCTLAGYCWLKFSKTTSLLRLLLNRGIDSKRYW